MFTSLYIAGKLGVFSAKGRSQSPRLMVAIAPILVAVLVSITRLRDRRHHPEGESSTLRGQLPLCVVRALTVYKRVLQLVMSAVGCSVSVGCSV